MISWAWLHKVDMLCLFQPQCRSKKIRTERSEKDYEEELLFRCTQNGRLPKFIACFSALKKRRAANMKGPRSKVSAGSPTFAEI